MDRHVDGWNRWRDGNRWTDGIDRIGGQTGTDGQMEQVDRWNRWTEGTDGQIGI